MSDSEDEKLIKQFRNRALQQEAWVRLVRYLVGAATTTIVMTAGYTGLTSTLMIIAIGILYVGINVWYDTQLWDTNNE